MLKQQENLNKNMQDNTTDNKTDHNESQNSRKHQNGSTRMGEMPVHRLFLSMSIPLIISMMVQALYNIVDSMFVARISEDALAAVSLIAPIQNLMISVAAGTAVGFNALISRRLGQKDTEAANRTANNGILLMIISWLVFLVVGLTCSRGFLLIQTDIPQIVEYGTTYMTIIMSLSIGLFGQVCIERILQSTGKTIFPMITQMTGALINIFFDWVLVFGIGPFPRLGVAGAALATIFGQCVAMALGLTFNLRYNREIKLGIRYMKPDLHIIKDIYRIGIPAILMMSISSVMNFGMNKIMLSFSSTAAALLGVYYKLQSIAFMPSFGMNNAMIPIIGYNYGAKKVDRIKKTYKIACTYICIIMWFVFALFQIMPAKLLGLFNASEEMLRIGIPAMHIVSIVFLCAGICVISSGVFQAMGKSVYSLWTSFIRQLIVLLPLAFLFAQTRNLNLVWLSLPLAEVAGFIATMMYMRKINQMLKHLVA